MKRIVSGLVVFIFILVVGCDVPVPPPVVGCMDIAASNYNSAAQEEDGTVCTQITKVWFGATILMAAN